MEKLLTLKLELVQQKCPYCKGALWKGYKKRASLAKCEGCKRVWNLPVESDAVKEQA